MGCCFGCLKAQNDEKPEGNKSIHAGMIRERKNDNVFDKYEIVQRLGEGSMGSVSLVRVKDEAKGGSAFKTKEKKFGFVTYTKKRGSLKEKDRKVDYALKTIILSRVSSEFVEELKNEILILRHMDHPNIVKAYEVFVRNWDISIIMELCSGGDLHSRAPYSEKDANSITKQLTSAIKYMHSKNIVHRDLKFENIMWESNGSDQIKVIDFGLSKYSASGEKYMHEGVGTIYTMAPQVLQGVYTSQADLWSIGVISYMLLSSEKPFYSKKRRRVIDKIMRCDYNFNSPVWSQISNDAKDFVSSLIVLDPKERLNAKQALEHPWLCHDDGSLSGDVPSAEILEGIEASLLNYAHASDLKKLALNVIAHKSSSEEIVALRNAFSHFDSEQDGFITYEEFCEALKECNLDQKTVEKIFISMDVDKNGTIGYCEFLAAVLEARTNIDEERVADAFDRLDHSDTGYISKEDLASLLGRDKDSEDVKKLIEEADTDKDGQISYEEFLAVFRKEEKRLAHEVVSMGSTRSETENGSEKLMGLDSVIPGGKYDKQNMSNGN